MLLFIELVALLLIIGFVVLAIHMFKLFHLHNDGEWQIVGEKDGIVYEQHKLYPQHRRWYERQRQEGLPVQTDWVKGKTDKLDI